MQHIFDHCEISVLSSTPVHGGDINRSFCLQCRDKSYFLKYNDAARYPGMLELEFQGLKELAAQSRLRLPGVIKTGIAGDDQYLLLEWLSPGKPGKNFWEDFGSKLAEMHLEQQQFFGWHADNYTGSLKQINTNCSDWPSFYSEYRILPLIRMIAGRKDFTSSEIRMAETLCGKMSQFFPEEHPSLLHGDLWSGNFISGPEGQAVIFDPAVYFGHREMDIGMTLLFGGFDQRFYSAYNEVYPMKKNWEQRTVLSQLYPLLVHAVLFGGHYLQKVREILKTYGS